MITAKELVLERARTVESAAPVPSPCISICRIDPVSEICQGCFRTLDEIAAWSTLDDLRKRDIWRAIERRAEAAA
ncbi:DUF1289 domain-containing protein [Caenimonas sedimenti]|uniref:DUF1289 domain-containing protein n=1 Tax=Caenimonas sedimenti TaxID=2596921 RepID=UPI00210256DA|nr:DUF1289 domain-containing protein [Caenimonas sedimenti]